MRYISSRAQRERQDTREDIREGFRSLFRGWCCIERFYSEDDRAERKIKRLDQLNWPPPRRSALPNKLRRRALTLSKSSDPITNLGESQCFILGRLPIEIRLIIWEQCLGGMTFHLDIHDLKLAHVRCGSPEPAMCNSRSGALGCNGGIRTKRKLLALPQTCKVIYSETIGILYAKNKFTVRNAYTIRTLPDLLLTRRFLTITTFSYQWFCRRGSLPKPPSEDHPAPNSAFLAWVEHWNVMASMKGLRVLVFTGFGSVREWKRLGEVQYLALLEPLKAVRAPVQFELRLPFCCNPNEAPWKDLPCRIRVTEQCADVWE